MAYDAQGKWTPEDDSVSTRVTGLMEQNSPLMQQAKTQGAQAANRRGLLNSSMGVQAGQQAAYGAALPIASQEAQQIAQKNIAAMDVGSKEKVAQINAAAHDRQYVASAAVEMEKKYAAMWNETMKNTNLNATALNNYYTHLNQQRDSDMALIEQIYGVDLNWSTAPATYAT
jgi:hypothetical protein